MSSNTNVNTCNRSFDAGQGHAQITTFNIDTDQTSGTSENDENMILSDRELSLCIRKFTISMITRSDTFDDSSRSQIIKPITKPFSAIMNILPTNFLRITY